ncbi:MAG: putative sulfate exporter family transporter [Bacteroidetes bacterium]|jgi:uncharacterized integral membrane protein (TIGR00698 family)|nr:putative sulfate exporter family transporter [Bacteroidota bacterium]
MKTAARTSEQSKTWSWKEISFIAVAVATLLPVVEPPVALFVGLVFSFTLGNPFKKVTKNLTHWLLQASVVGLGFGMNIHEAMAVGKTGFVLTASSITLTLSLGLLIGYLLRTNKKTSLLISSGTAICGGSAIAAMTPVVNADEDETSIALSTVFVLNAVALFVFPVVGHLLNMSQEQFGTWAAIAIHDTSSVVGAAQKYGDQALHIATTIKLERALWIIPLSLVAALFYKKGGKKVAIPYFIFLYVVAMLVNTYFPAISTISSSVVFLSKRGLTLTLFLIGAGLSQSTLKNIGLRPFLQGIILWILISCVSLLVVINL